MQKINTIIDDTPILVDIHKDFLKTMIKARKELILEVALVKNKNTNIVMSNSSPHYTNKESQINDMREATKKASLKLGLGENTKGVDKDLER